MVVIFSNIKKSLFPKLFAVSPKKTLEIRFRKERKKIFFKGQRTACGEEAEKEEAA
jgi:hypothetical protein